MTHDFVAWRKLESERDRAIEIAEELRAERDAAVQVRDQFVMKADECLARALAAEQAAEQARNALQQILEVAEVVESGATYPKMEGETIVAIARAALAGEGK